MWQAEAAGPAGEVVDEREKAAAELIAESSAAALEQQSQEAIPFKEGYFLPEDEAGVVGTLREDQVSADGTEPSGADEAAEVSAVEEQEQPGNKVSCACKGRAWRACRTLPYPMHWRCRQHSDSFVGVVVTNEAR